MVAVPDPVAAPAAAVSVIVCVAPGVTFTDAGLAVTPAGNPAIVSAIGTVYPFTAVDVTVICCVDPPAVNATLAGDAVNAKSCSTLAFDPHPPTIDATKLSANTRHPIPQLNLCV
jgi:hypothetical protein